MKSLIELLQPFAATKIRTEVCIVDMTSDSRAVQPGSLFLAYPGEQTDGRAFIHQAILAGAVAIAYEIQNMSFSLDQVNIPCIPIQNLQQQLGLIAARFYDYPSRNLSVVGVTGTNGKTTVTHCIAQVLTALGQPAAVIGTLGSGLFAQHKTVETLHTTPDAIRLQKYFYQLKAQGAKTVAMEVSSHGLVQHRLSGVDIDYAILTNLSRDHLDYHSTMEAYQEAKFRLFNDWPLKAAVLNWDDNVGRLFAGRIRSRYPVLAYSLTDVKDSGLSGVWVEKIQPLEKGFQVTVNSLWGRGVFCTQLGGRFNIMNLLAVLTVLGQMGVPFDAILATIPAVRPVAGRMQWVKKNKGPAVLIDYAHTPDALEKVLQAVKEHCTGQVWCVFGCGGERDRGKRPEMAKIAEQYADQVVVTSDNPRTECPDAIIAEIVAGFNDLSQKTVIPDRKEAIHFALREALSDDLIVIAGKGHEPYQVIGDSILEWSDEQCVLQIVE